MNNYCIIRWNKVPYGCGRYDSMLYTPDMEKRADYRIVQRDLIVQEAIRRRKELNEKDVVSC